MMRVATYSILASLENMLDRKSTIFSVVVAGVLSILALPFITPHLLHGFHLAHIALHVGGIILAVFISTIGAMAYYRIRTKRLLLTEIGFANFAVAESVLLVDATWPAVYDTIIPLSEIGHLLIFATMGLMVMGMFRDD